MKRSAIVVGATGLVGRNLVELLCDDPRYVSVVTIGRNKLSYKHEKLQQHIRSLDAITEADLELANEVYCCLGTTIKKAKTKEQFEKVDFEYPLNVASVAKNKGIEHFLVISAMGASEKSPAYYSRVKAKLEKELIKLQFKRLSIIRPSLLTGDREEFRMGERAGAVVLGAINPLLIGPLKKYRSIQARQVATAMVSIALNKHAVPVTTYTSDQLHALSIPPYIEKVDEIDREAKFNWSKINEAEDVVDEEVVFDRSKISAAEDDLPK